MGAGWRIATVLAALAVGLVVGLSIEDAWHRRLVALTGRSARRAALLTTAQALLAAVVVVASAVVVDVVPARPVLPVLVVAGGLTVSTALWWPLVGPSVPDMPGPRAADRGLTRVGATPTVAAVAGTLGVALWVLVLLPTTVMVAWYAVVLE